MNWKFFLPTKKYLKTLALYWAFVVSSDGHGVFYCISMFAICAFVVGYFDED